MGTGPGPCHMHGGVGMGAPATCMRGTTWLLPHAWWGGMGREAQHTLCTQYTPIRHPEQRTEGESYLYKIHWSCYIYGVYIPV